MPSYSGGDESGCLSSAALASQHNSMAAGWRTYSADEGETLPSSGSLFQALGQSEATIAGPPQDRPQHGSSAALAALSSSSAGSDSSLEEPRSFHYTGAGTENWLDALAKSAPLSRSCRQ